MRPWNRLYPRFVGFYPEFGIKLFNLDTAEPDGIFYISNNLQPTPAICQCLTHKIVAQVCKDIRIGKILIQTNWDTGEPELYYLRLPKVETIHDNENYPVCIFPTFQDIKDYQVILMDATVATGAAAMMAIRVLLDHDVPEENINLVSLLMAESGVTSSLL